MIQIELKQQELEKNINDVEDKVESIKEVVSLNSHAWRNDTNKLINKIALARGGLHLVGEVRVESYNLFDKRFQVNTSLRFENKRKRMIEEGVSKTKIKALNMLDVIAEERKLTEGYLSIVKDMAIKSGVVA